MLFMAFNAKSLDVYADPVLKKEELEQLIVQLVLDRALVWCLSSSSGFL